MTRNLDRGQGPGRDWGRSYRTAGHHLARVARDIRGESPALDRLDQVDLTAEAAQPEMYCSTAHAASPWPGVAAIMPLTLTVGALRSPKR
jgi:hypothetical protein